MKSGWLVSICSSKVWTGYLHRWCLYNERWHCVPILLVHFHGRGLQGSILCGWLGKGLCWGEQDDWYLRPNYRTTWICNVDLLQQSWQLALAKYGKLSSLTHVSCCHHVLAGISEFLKSANWHGFFADEELWDVWYWHSPMSLQSLCTKNIFFFEAWYPIALCRGWARFWYTRKCIGWMGPRGQLSFWC